MSGISPHDNKTICVIGGTGFIGKYLIDELIKQNNYTIKVLTRDIDIVDTFSGKVQLTVGDLMKFESIINFIVNDSVVINLAYLKPEKKKDNLKSAENIATACIEVGAKRLIHCSTAMVVGRTNETVITEDTICKPVTEYEKIKFSTENLLVKRLKEKCEVIVLRPTAVFGAHGKNLIKTTNEFVNGSQLKRLVRASILSKRRMNLVCVENVVEAILFFIRLRKNVSGQSFIISDDDVKENNYYDVLKILADNLGIEAPKKIDFPFQPFVFSALLNILRGHSANPNRIYSSEKLNRLGFRRAISFQDGVSRYALWYKNSKEEFST